jgi:two-component sensor histidine kinase/PAS domain-containing protein
VSEDCTQRRRTHTAGFPEAETDPVFAAIVRRTQQPFLLLADDWIVLFANPSFYKQFQVRREETEGRSIFELGNRQWDIPRLHELLEDVLAMNHSVESFRVEHEFEQIGPRFMFMSADRIEIEGERDRILLAIDDVTESEGNQEFQEKLINAVREGLLVLNWDLRVIKVNECFCEAFRVRREEAEGRFIYELGGGEFDIPELRRQLEEVLPKESSFDDFDVRRDFKTIGRRTLLLNGRRLDHLQLILLVVRDVTETRLAEEHRRTVIGELHHRVKNILANVSAIARQTRQRSATVEDYAEAFEGRLAALSRVHDMITSDGHEGASLLQILCMELKAHGAREDKDFRVDGPDVQLEPRQAQAMILAVHELTTNAVKYGALQHRGGMIDVAWKVTESGGETRLALTWRERGVALPAAPPQKGFGSAMIEDNLPRMLDGSVDFRFRDDGVECRIDFPVRAPPARMLAD